MNNLTLLVMMSTSRAFSDACAGEFADEVVARLDRLWEMGKGHLSTFLGNKSVSDNDHILDPFCPF